MVSSGLRVATSGNVYEIPKNGDLQRLIEPKRDSALLITKTEAANSIIF